MAIRLLSDKAYRKILQNRFKTLKVKFCSAELKSISENVEGFLGEHYYLHITYKLEDITATELFFIKNKPTKNKLLVDISDGINAYNKEIFVYDYLLKEFQKYGCNTSFAASCYYCLPNQTLVLENLLNKGYVLHDRNTSFGVPQIKCTLKSLAQFHACSLVYERAKSKELQKPFTIADKYPDILKEGLYVMRTNPSSIAMRWWNGSYKTIAIIIDLLPWDEMNKSKFHSMVFNHSFGAVFVDETNFIKTCGHGDLWSNNMLFKYNDEEPVECCLLDFQMCRYFYPSFDVVLAIFSNTTPSFRKEHLQKLYQFYYEMLQSTLRTYDYEIEDVMSFEDFLKSIKLVLRDALLQTISAVTELNLPKQLLNSFVNENNPEKLEEFMFDNENMCAEAFKTNEKYRKIVTEVFEEYYDILLKYL